MQLKKVSQSQVKKYVNSGDILDFYQLRLKIAERLRANGCYPVGRSREKFGQSLQECHKTINEVVKGLMVRII
jgi:hypothetical protein